MPLGWGQPACALDPYVEFRHFTNNGAVKSGDREKGFYSLDGALQYFCENGIDTAHKTDMRDRIVQGPPFTADEREIILDYCEDDMRALALLVKHIVPTIRSLPHAMMRAKFMWALAQQERRGIPLDLPLSTVCGQLGRHARSISCARWMRHSASMNSMKTASRIGVSTVSPTMCKRQPHVVADVSGRIARRA